MRLGFVCCSETLSTSARRRADAFEHDAELEPIRAAFGRTGHGVVELDWRADDGDYGGADLLFIRTVWDYTDHQEAFLAFLSRAAKMVPVANHPDLIRWNLAKDYLGELAQAGLPVIDSVFVTAETRLGDLFAALGADEIVIKPTVGAGGTGQARYRRAETDPDQPVYPGVFAQPFLRQVMSEGELSFVFLNGTYSHAVHKACAPGEFRVQSIYGGVDTRYDAPAGEIATARRFIDALPYPALAARVDMLRDGAGLTLMELEVIEPYLYPVFEPAFGMRMVEATIQYLYAGG